MYTVYLAFNIDTPPYLSSPREAIHKNSASDWADKMEHRSSQE